MHRQYTKWYSRSLNRDMELLVFGHAGPPVIVFPSSMGAFFEYEDRGMVGAVAHKLERGDLQLICVSSVDSESWYNRGIHPKHRVMRHLQYEQYLLGRAVPDTVRWVTNQNSRWGSCTPAEGSIRLSHRLRGMPEYVLDYVLLHELAHLLVPGHGTDDWADALHRVLGNDELRAHLEAGARQQAALFSWDATAEATYAVYERARSSLAAAV